VIPALETATGDVSNAYEPAERLRLSGLALARTSLVMLRRPDYPRVDLEGARLRGERIPAAHL
jgi:hypothetical protein